MAFFFFFPAYHSPQALLRPTQICLSCGRLSHFPDDRRIMMRWWSFGPAVTKPEIKLELEQMKAAGIGGVEIATRIRSPWMTLKPDSAICHIFRTKYRCLALCCRQGPKPGDANRHHPGKRLALRRSAHTYSPGCGGNAS